MTGCPVKSELSERQACGIGAILSARGIVEMWRANTTASRRPATPTHRATNGHSRSAGRARLIPIVATQSISSLQSAVQGEKSWRTLLQCFRTKIFLASADEFTAHVAAELCGKAERLTSGRRNVRLQVIWRQRLKRPRRFPLWRVGASTVADAARAHRVRGPARTIGTRFEFNSSIAAATPTTHQDP
jgi:hypothetical protein